MKRFVALYMAPPAAIDEMMKNTTPEISKQHTESWEAWMKAKKSSLVDEGAPLGKNKRVSGKGVTDMRNEVCGYTIVAAESLEEAASLFSDNPMLAMPEAYVDVLEVKPM